jgi:spore coat polysaccharide biosynthesis predicted glycosyltransferase SpsG/CMP-N-acetylneuraminic acid synthetase
VTTDDEEIATVAGRYGAEVIQRPGALAGDDVTLDPVIHHAVTMLEAGQQYRPDIVATVQPTSPLLRAETIDRAIELVHSGGFDTVISAVEDTHLSWTRDREGRFAPLYDERLNRQFLPPTYRETGAILASRREFITPESRIGPRVTIVELPPERAIDIDTYFDWWLAEKSMARRRVVLRTDGSSEIGLGHVYRCLTLAGRLLDHEVIFVMSDDLDLGTSLVREHHYSVSKSAADPLETIHTLSPHIVINDILDTTSDYIDALRELGAFVVNFEDLGTGAGRAHLVINSLYDSPVPLKNHVWGPEYACLRGEFYSTPTKTIRPEVRRVLLTFGGVDQGNLTTRVLRAVGGIPGDFEVHVVLGLGYAHREELETIGPGLRRSPVVHHNVRSMSEHILNADLVITSAGRTVLEVAAIGTPCLVLAQNEREMRHLHARSKNGVVNLGLGHQVPQTLLVSTLRDIIESAELRREMNRRMLALDVRGGCERVVGLITSRYRAFEKERTR